MDTTEHGSNSSVTSNLCQTELLYLVMKFASQDDYMHTFTAPNKQLSELSVKVATPPGSLTMALKKLLIQMKNSDPGPLNPKHLFSEICKKSPRFRGYQQQDSQELLRCLLDSIKTEQLRRLKIGVLNAFGVNAEEGGTLKQLSEEKKDIVREYVKSLSSTAVDIVFGGTLDSIVVCHQCHKESRVRESFLDLSLSLAPLQTKSSMPVSGSKNKRMSPLISESATLTEVKEEDANDGLQYMSKYKLKAARKAEKKKAKKNKSASKRQPKHINQSDDMAKSNDQSDDEKELNDQSDGEVDIHSDQQNGSYPNDQSDVAVHDVMAHGSQSEGAVQLNCSEGVGRSDHTGSVSHNHQSGCENDSQSCDKCQIEQPEDKRDSDQRSDLIHSSQSEAVHRNVHAEDEGHIDEYGCGLHDNEQLDEEVASHVSGDDIMDVNDLIHSSQSEAVHRNVHAEDKGHIDEYGCGLHNDEQSDGEAASHVSGDDIMAVSDDETSDTCAEVTKEYSHDPLFVPEQVNNKLLHLSEEATESKLAVDSSDEVRCESRENVFPNVICTRTPSVCASPQTTENSVTNPYAIRSEKANDIATGEPFRFTASLKADSYENISLDNTMVDSLDDDRESVCSNSKKSAIFLEIRDEKIEMKSYCTYGDWVIVSESPSATTDSGYGSSCNCTKTTKGTYLDKNTSVDINMENRTEDLSPSKENMDHLESSKSSVTPASGLDIKDTSSVNSVTSKVNTIGEDTGDIASHVKRLSLEEDALDSENKSNGLECDDSKPSNGSGVDESVNATSDMCSANCTRVNDAYSDMDTTSNSSTQTKDSGIWGCDAYSVDTGEASTTRHLGNSSPNLPSQEPPTSSPSPPSRELTLGSPYLPSPGECSVMSCLSVFCAKETLTGKNKFACEECTKARNGCGTPVCEESGDKEEASSKRHRSQAPTVYTEATKQLLLSHPPLVLTLHLKRFQQVLFGLRKVAKHVDFPLVLDMAPFCSSQGKALPDANGQILYSLIGAVDHSGGLNSGHYTAYIKLKSKPTLDLNRDIRNSRELEAYIRETWNEAHAQKCTSQGVPQGQWYYVSDSHSVLVPESRVLRSQAYMLFYERLPLVQNGKT
ncbi:uncharacterized protein LOC5505120 isoform X2 [Nematostella vectensis]|uniref:uncharacterized protein LOC5505120 isoform X2 n=1 Tax=Nematostella vectensis TaxID=45351 RepID=UPI00207749D3|nr:uncharacterized protein LOC5505120 isoform X2 [Nematostella vectensis]